MGVFVDVIGLIGAGAIIAYILFVRRNRESVLAKYKPDTPEHKMYMKLMETKRLVGTIVVFVFFLGSLIWKIITTPPDAKSSPLFVTIVMFSVFTLVFLITLSRSKKS